MAGSSKKKSTTKGEAAPAVIKDTKPSKKGKRKPKDDLETKVNLKKPKKDVIALFEKKKSDQKEMKGFADTLRQIEAKVDLLATKTDLHAILISAKCEKVPAMKPPPAKAASDSDDSYTETSSDDEVTATKNPNAAAKNLSVKAKTENSSSEDESSSSDDEPAKKTAASAKPNSRRRRIAFIPSKRTARSAKPNAITKPAAKDSSSSDGGSISIEGFDSSLPVDDIKSVLSKHFSSFGEITRVYVPTDRETGVSLGYAYIDLKEGAEKALELGEHDVGGWNLVVGKAEPIRNGSTWPYPGRCGNLGLCLTC